MLNNILDTMPTYSDFQVWFLPSKTVHNTWSIVEAGEHSLQIGLLTERSADNLPAVELVEGLEITESVILDQFNLFVRRPEYFLTRPVMNVNELDQESLINEYQARLIGAAFARALTSGKNPDDTVKAVMNFIDWIQSTDFYVAPGSTQYHDSEPSGLLKHSLRVFNHIIRLRYDDVFASIDFDSAALVALTHDWCKIGLYEMYMRNVKNEETGKWEQVPSYKHNQKGVPLGHGVTSMFIVSKFFRLSPEEALALRWHMGEYNVADNEKNELHLANETYPLVFLIQFADRLAITKYAN